ncbi:MAG: RNA polymerase sigma factor [Bacteroidia bacterium]
MDIPDGELAKGCSQGKEEYCKILFERFYGKMFNVCRQYATDKDEAKDMLQEGFIRVFKSISQYEHKGSLEGWVRRVMVTSAINHCKKYKMNGSVRHLANDMHVNGYDDETKEESFTLNYAVEKMDAERLLNLIQGLPPVYRMVFNLCAIEGFSHQEISQMLGITESTSRSNLTKARQKLQQMIEKKTQTKNISYEG